MAQVSFMNEVSHQTFYDPNYNRRRFSRRPTKPSPVMVHLDISHRWKRLVYEIPDDPAESRRVIDSTLVSKRQRFWTQIDLLKNSFESSLHYLSKKFDRLGISRRFFRALTRNIIEEVMKSTRELAHQKRVVKVPVVCKVFTDSVGTITERELRESEPEFNGMVPAATESLKMVKENVKVEEKSDCPVCLEDLGESASALPCKHMFHENCIIKWLQNSHYCPICRFELPTAAA